MHEKCSLKARIICTLAIQLVVMKDRYKIAIVSTHALFLKAFAMLVHNIGFPVHLECNSYNELISTIDVEDLPNLLLLYDNNGNENNEALIKGLCSSFPTMKILILTNSTDNDAINNMIVNGAKGFVYLSIDPTELKHAINKVMKHKIYYPELLTQVTHCDFYAGKLASASSQKKWFKNR